MHRRLLAVCLVLLPVSAFAQLPVAAAPPPPSTGVPTYWVMLVSGEKDGTPWIKTVSPETLGGQLKGTGAWSCSYPPTERGTEEKTGYEQMELDCSAGEAETFVRLRCPFRLKPRPGRAPGKHWKRGELKTLNLRTKGDPNSTITVSLRCDVDAAFAVQ